MMMNLVLLNLEVLADLSTVKYKFGCTRPRRSILACTCLYWEAQGTLGAYLVQQVYTRPVLSVLACTGLYWRQPGAVPCLQRSEVVQKYSIEHPMEVLNIHHSHI